MSEFEHDPAASHHFSTLEAAQNWSFERNFLFSPMSKFWKSGSETLTDIGSGAISLDSPEEMPAESPSFSCPRTYHCWPCSFAFWEQYLRHEQRRAGTQPRRQQHQPFYSWTTPSKPVKSWVFTMISSWIKWITICSMVSWTLGWLGSANICWDTTTETHSNSAIDSAFNNPNFVARNNRIEIPDQLISTVQTQLMKCARIYNNKQQFNPYNHIRKH